MDKIVETIDAYEALLSRACEIVGFYVDQPSMRITVNGDKATLSWANVSHDYGECSLDRETSEFQASLLALSDEAFSQWKAEENARQKLRRKEELLKKQKAAEALELVEFRRLQAKFAAKV